MCFDAIGDELVETGAKAERPRRAAKDSRTLAEIGQEFCVLRSHLGEVMYRQQQTPDSEWTVELEARWCAVTDPIRDQLAQLRDSIIGRSARSLDELRFKAIILLDLVEENGRDAVTRSILSLCRDLVELAGEDDCGAVSPRQIKSKSDSVERSITSVWGASDSSR